MTLPAEFDADCRSIDAELDRHFGKPRRKQDYGSGSELSPQARRHLKHCLRCRRLYRWITDELPSGEVAPDLCGKMQRTLQASSKPVSPLPPTKTLVTRFLAAFVLFALPLSMILGFAGLHRMRASQLIGVGVILAAGAAVLSFSLAWQMSPGSRQRFSLGLAVAGLVVAFVASIGMLFPWQPTGEFITEGWPCSAVGIAIAIPAALLSWLFVRRGTPLSIKTLGLGLGAVSGLLAVTILQIRCRMQEAAHLLVWHGGVLALSALAGILLARAFEAFREQRL